MLGPFGRVRTYMLLGTQKEKGMIIDASKTLLQMSVFAEISARKFGCHL